MWTVCRGVGGGGVDTRDIARRGRGKIAQTDSPLATPGPRTKGWKNEGRKVNKKSQWTLNYASGSPPGDMDWRASLGESPPRRCDRRLLARRIS